ncbi:hypothetical protein D1F64_21690 [Breoghania sp. L-A4]|nr:hypothetical protein D1F64_21690 [Breoghania sp. L-A4]
MLSGDVVSALAGPLAPAQYAQLGQTGQALGERIGAVETVNGTASVQHVNGVVDQLSPGTPVYQGDVVSTGGDSALSLTFVDDTVFSLSADARMVLDELVYAPGGSDNSMVMNLVQGTFVFVTGQVAPTGDMRVETPVATMGIRGTTPVVQIAAVDGSTRFSLSPDPDGSVGSYQLFDRASGALLGSVSTTDLVLRILSVGATPLQETKTQSELDQERVETERAFEAYRQSRQGGQDNQDQNNNGPDNGPDSGPQDGQGDGPPPGPNDGTPPPLGDQGSLLDPLGPPSNGLDLLNGGDGPGPQGGPPMLGPSPTMDVDFAKVMINLPQFTITTNEDQQITVTGLSINNANSGPLSVTITAMSTVTLAQINGLTFYKGDGTGDETMTFFGSQAAVNAALNGLIYTPTQDAESGGLTITVSNGTNSATTTLPISITPQPDAPEALDIALTVSEGGVVTAPFLGADPDIGDTLTLNSLTLPDGGTLVDNGDGTFTFSTNGAFDYLNAGETAQVMFDYSVIDSTALVSNVATVTITITGEGNHVPEFKAAVVEEGFESGLGAWDTVISGSIVTGDATEGGQFARLTTSMAGNATDTAIEDAFGLDPGTFDGMVEGDAVSGAAMVKMITVEAGDTVSFDWRFSTNDYITGGTDYDDFGAVIFGDLAMKLSGVTFLGNVSGDTSTTGWQTFSFTATESGTFKVGFAALDVRDGLVGSTLDIDNIRSGSLSAVITELEDDTPVAEEFTHSVNGVIGFTDLDASDTHTVSVAPLNATGYLGAFSATVDTEGSGDPVVQWSFSVSDGALDFLDDGETLTQSYTLTLDDGNGGTTSEVVTITLNGSGTGGGASLVANGVGEPDGGHAEALLASGPAFDSLFDPIAQTPAFSLDPALEPGNTTFGLEMPGSEMAEAETSGLTGMFQLEERGPDLQALLDANFGTQVGAPDGSDDGAQTVGHDTSGFMACNVPASAVLDMVFNDAPIISR